MHADFHSSMQPCQNFIAFIWQTTIKSNQNTKVIILNNQFSTLLTSTWAQNGSRAKVAFSI